MKPIKIIILAGISDDRAKEIAKAMAGLDGVFVDREERHNLQNEMRFELKALPRDFDVAHKFIELDEGDSPNPSFNHIVSKQRKSKRSFFKITKK